MVLYLRTFVAVFLVAFGCNFIAANDEARFDCYPERLSRGEKAVNETLCEARGCTWKKSRKNKASLTL